MCSNGNSVLAMLGRLRGKVKDRLVGQNARVWCVLERLQELLINMRATTNDHLNMETAWNGAVVVEALRTRDNPNFQAVEY